MNGATIIILLALVLFVYLATTGKLTAVKTAITG